jgi:hypothetical protein
MKHSKFKIKKTVLVIGLLVLFVLGCHFTQELLPADPKNTCGNVITTTEFNSWFVSGTASLNGAVNPANSITFANTPNCSFYKWSEQMFLWLTSPASGLYGSNGLVMTSPVFFDVSLPDPFTHERTFLPHRQGFVRPFNLRTAQRGLLDLPVMLERGTLNMLQVLPQNLSAAGNPIVLDSAGRQREIKSVKINDGNRPVFFDIDGKAIEGAKAFIDPQLKDKGLRLREKMSKFEQFDKSRLVQKIIIDKKIFLLDTFGSLHETEQGQSGDEVLMAQNHSLVYYSLTVNNVYMLYRTMQGASVPAGTAFPTTQANINSISAFALAHNRSPIIDSQALAIEIKSAWVEAKGLPDSNKFIRLKAEIPVYDATNANDWVPTGTKTVELAMVGMHVVGSTISHPEMLWATFEHVSSTPAAAYSYTNTSNASGNVPQQTSGFWVFCASNAAAPFNEQHITMNGTHIQPFGGFPISPSNIRREMPFGKPGTDVNSNAEVISTNNAVRSKLDPADVRINYIQTGTTWFIPNSTTEVGTNRLANTTMETFVQGNNCFACHSGRTVDVSHVFTDTKPLF